MNRISKFLSENDTYFTKYTSKDNIASNYCNWLYMFDVDKYSNNTAIILPNNSFKFGHTKHTLKLRISQYNPEVRITNIECIRCNFPEERETVLKQYLRLKTTLIPTCGTEYYTDCKNTIKLIILILVSMPDNDILSYYQTRSEDFLSRIEQIYSNISTSKSRINLNMTTNVINNIVYNNDNVVCQYCMKAYSSMYTLLNHQKTTKFCLEIQNKSIEDASQHTCIHCNNVFTLKQSLEKHLNTCKEKKRVEEEQKITVLNEEVQRSKSILKEYEELKEKCASLTELLKEKDKQIFQLTISLQTKETDGPNVINIYKSSQQSVQYSNDLESALKKINIFTDETVKNKIKSITPIQLIEPNNNDVLLNFYSNIGRLLSDMAIIIDKSRGIILVKPQNNTKQRQQSKAFIHSVLSITEDALLKLIDNTNIHINQNQTINVEMKQKMSTDLAFLTNCITHKTMDIIIFKINSIFAKHCTYISKK